MELDTIVCGDCLDVMGAMPANSVDLIATDPPYYKVKNEPWDRQWNDPAAFLDWMGQLCEQWERILKPNGSLYVFASPQMAARVEVKIGEWFNPLNRIRWIKEQGWHKKTRPVDLRSYLSPWEEIIFAEHYGADNIAKGEAGYAAKCDELRGFVFEPLRAYLESERQRAGWTKAKVNKLFDGPNVGQYWWQRRNWQLPTKENYEILRKGFNNGRIEFLRREYEDLRREYEDLRREYEDLRREYEDLRRPFNASPERAYTDVWTFATVSPYPGKHPCEKPLDLMEHIVITSSKPGGVVFDGFMGGGTTAVAALKNGRHFYGCDKVESYVTQANERIEKTRLELSQMTFALQPGGTLGT